MSVRQCAESVRFSVRVCGGPYRAAHSRAHSHTASERDGDRSARKRSRARPRPLGSVAERVAQLAADLAELERDVAAARRGVRPPLGHLPRGRHRGGGDGMNGAPLIRRQVGTAPRTPREGSTALVPGRSRAEPSASRSPLAQIPALPSWHRPRTSPLPSSERAGRRWTGRARMRAAWVTGHPPQGRPSGPPPSGHGSGSLTSDGRAPPHRTAPTDSNDQRTT